MGPMTRVLLFAAGAFLATSCSGGDGQAASLGSVKRTLTAAHLGPQKVKLVTTVRTTAPTEPTPVNFCAAEAVAQPSATSLDVDRGRAIVMVFESDDAADEWTPRPECGAKPLRVGNVIAVPTHGDLSPRLQHALERLR